MQGEKIRCSANWPSPSSPRWLRSWKRWRTRSPRRCPLLPRTAPGCGWSRPGGYATGCASYHRFRVSTGHIGEAISQARAGADEALRRAAADANAAASAAETRIADTGQQELRSALRPELAYSPGRRARSPDAGGGPPVRAPVGDGRPRRKPPRPQPRAPEGWHWLLATDELARARRVQDLDAAAVLPGPRAERRRRLAGPDLQFRAFCARRLLAAARAVWQLVTIGAEGGEPGRGAA